MTRELPGPQRRTKAYSSRANRACPRCRGIRTTAPVKIDQQTNSQKHRAPAVAGHCCANDTSTDSIMRSSASTGHKQYRAVATRYDKLAVRSEATTHLAAIHIWLRDFSNTV